MPKYKLPSMAVKIKCTSCNKEISVPEDWFAQNKGCKTHCPACNYKFRITGVFDGQTEKIDLNSLIVPRRLVRTLPERAMRKYCFLPISRREDIITLAFAETPSPELVARIKAAVFCEIKVVTANREDIVKKLDEYLLNRNAPKTPLITRPPKGTDAAPSASEQQKLKADMDDEEFEVAL